MDQLGAILPTLKEASGEVTLSLTSTKAQVNAQY